MGSIYNKSTKELFREFVESFVPPPPTGLGLLKRKPLSEGGFFTRKEILAWFQKKYPNLKKGTVNAHLIIMSVNAPSRLHHNLRPNGADDLLFQINKSSFRLYLEGADPAPLYKKDAAAVAGEVGEDEEEQEEVHEFAYEKDLRNFLATNIKVIRSTMAVYQDGDVNGVEFPVGGRFIDILALEDGQDLVVIELKVSKGYDRAIGQLLRYMGWIEENLAEPGQRVKGMVICRSISEDLRLAASKVKDVELFEYQMSVTVEAVKLGKQKTSSE